MNRATSRKSSFGKHLFERVRDSVECWWILLRAKLMQDREIDSRVETCLKLKKGTRFRLTGGRIRLLDNDELCVRPAQFPPEMTKDEDAAKV